ncbi:Aldehyde dehydrogenase family protein [Streptomyces sp. ok210]|jgi:hypothetical protein|nr:Aldehyde dehydrogenase family protein [Streptomyces sp. ok210]
MSFRTINLATGEFVKEFPLQSDDEVFAALDTAARLYREDWKFRPVAERARIVARAAEVLREKRDEYVEYLTLEMGKVTRFGYFEVDLVADSHTACLQCDPVAALDALVGGADVLQNAAIALDGARRCDIVVVACDEDTAQTERTGFGENNPESPRGQATPSGGGPDAISDVPAAMEQKSVQTVPQIDGSQIAVALDDPPVGGMDPLISQDN